MQKIIRLTESDLTQIVKLVIMENKKDNKIDIDKLFVGSGGMVVFKNEDGEYCNVTKRHTNNGIIYSVVFNKDMVSLATRPAMNTKVAGKVNKMLMSDGFKVVK